MAAVIRAGRTDRATATRNPGLGQGRFWKSGRVGEAGQWVWLGWRGPRADEVTGRSGAELELGRSTEKLREEEGNSDMWARPVSEEGARGPCAGAA
jgi:hypothetical protein